MCKRHFEQRRWAEYVRPKPPVRVLRYTITCQHCGRTVPTYRSDQQYCNKSCAAKSRASEAYRTRRPKTCNGCGVTFQASRCRKYCTYECAMQTRYQKSTAVAIYARPPWHKYISRLPATPQQMPRRLFAGRCKECKAPFVSTRITQTCSPECRKAIRKETERRGRAARRARERDAYVEHVSPKKVFESDGYRCHVCKRRTDPTKAVPNPLAPTIDHVIPLAAGREAGGVHAYSNCRTACFECNSIKGARVGHYQITLY